jgi:hypothetical protein
VMPNFSKKCLVFEVFLQPQRFAHRHILRRAFLCENGAQRQAQERT